MMDSNYEKFGIIDINGKLTELRNNYGLYQFLALGKQTA
jgi:hypothetical protein